MKQCVHQKAEKHCIFCWKKDQKEFWLDKKALAKGDQV